MEIRFTKKSTILDVSVCAVAAILSVGVMLYGVIHFGFKESWPELVLNMFYIACLVMTGMYFFKGPITTNQFNYWCSVCVGMTVLLRDILFAPPITYYPIRIACLTLSVLLLVMLTYFYSRKDWETYSKRNLWVIFLVDMLIAALSHVYIALEPSDEYTSFMLTEIWIRPTITYGMVACFVKETDKK